MCFSELWTWLTVGMLCSALVIHCSDFGCCFLLVVDRKSLYVTVNIQHRAVFQGSESVDVSY